jgi:hypothetical protein
MQTSSRKNHLVSRKELVLNSVKVYNCCHMFNIPNDGLQ